jgi:ribosomal protein S1
MHVAAEKKLLYLVEKQGWKNANNRFPSETVCDGQVRGKADFGLFIQVIGGPLGMLHMSELPAGKSIDDLKNAIRSE